MIAHYDLWWASYTIATALALAGLVAIAWALIKINKSRIDYDKK